MVNYVTNIALPPLKKEVGKRFQFQHLKYMDLTEDWNGEFIRHSFCSTDHLIFCFIHLFDCLFQNSPLQKVFWTKTSLNTFFFSVMLHKLQYPKEMNKMHICQYKNYSWGKVEKLCNAKMGKSDSIQDKTVKLRQEHLIWVW